MIVLSNVKTLYDGKSSDEASIHHGVDVYLGGDRIQDIRPHSFSGTGETQVRIDCSKYTVTPGLVDAHGHVTLLGLEDSDLERASGQDVLLWVEKVLHATLVEGGVTTVRDVGGATHIVKRLIDDGSIIGPRLKIAICMLSTTGGHADFRGPDRCCGDLPKIWPPGPGRPSSLVDGPWEGRQRVRELAGCGADLIKICTSPGVASPGDHLENQDFSAEEVRAICLEADARGLPVAAHAHSRAGIEMAIENGVDDIQHASFLDAELAEKAAARGCAVTPTSWVVNELPKSKGLSPFVMEKARKVAEVHREAVQHAHAAGLPLLAGTDPVLPGMHGRNYMEMVALTQDGLTPLQAWHAMTGLGAEKVDQTDTGVLEKGKRADMLICEGDVLDDPALLDLGALREVLKDGVAYRGRLKGLPQRTYRDTTLELWPRPELNF
ncbi:MAG: amidohydrolase family protein [Acidobacteriota bacterium]